VTISVGGNSAPTAANDNYTATEDAPLTVTAANGVLRNDTDPQNRPLTAVLVAPPAQGTLTLNSDGSFTYTPPANFSGTTSFTYKANNGTQDSNVATATIIVAPVNDPPVAQNDSYFTTRDTPLTVAAPGVLINDTDPDNTALTASLVSGPSHGTLTLQPDGAFTYIPQSGFTGTDTFVYRVSDGSASDDGVVTITVNPPTNQPPLATADAYTTSEDTPLTVSAAAGVLANDSDPNNDPLTAVLVASPQHGTLTLNADGSFTYTPAANFAGTDTFTYKASDGTLESSPATVTITVQPVNDAPVGVADQYHTSPDTPLNVGAGAGVLANDTDADGDPLTAVLVDQPQHGTLVLNSDGSFSYTPQAGFRGNDTFTYRAFDGTANSAPTTVTITVTHPPVAANDTYETNEDTPLVVSAATGVLANDSDADGDTLTAILIAQPQHGTVVLNADGSFTYTPAANFFGTDSFRYQASDGVVASQPATVTITIHAVNDPPVATADQYTTPGSTPLVVPAASGVLANDNDVDGDPLTAILNSQPQHGTLVLQADGSFTYTPQAGFRGIDSFVYQASDGIVESTPVTVTIVVNTPPTAANDEYTTVPDTPLVVSAAQGLLANDSDADGDALTASVVTPPQHGTLVLNDDGSFTYTPQAGFVGTDGFSYRVSDGLAQSAVAAVTIHVQPLNHPPQAQADAYTTSEDTPLVVNAAAGVLANDSDPDGDPLSAVLVASPQHGTLTLNADGSFTYTPSADFFGTDTFTYKASDGTLDSSVATVTITVNAVNDPPVGVADTYVTPVNTPLSVPAANGVLANDTDADGDPLSAVLVDPPAQGTLALESDGSFVYTPAQDAHGTVTFTYRSSDGAAQSLPVTVTIKINTTPVAADDSYSTSEDVPLTIADPGVLANDTDADGDPLSTTIVSQPQHGIVLLNAAGGLVYTPAPNFHGTDQFTYRATDGFASSQTATVTITVISVNDAPQGFFDSYTVTRGGTLTVPAVDGVLANDLDADGDSLAAILVQDVAHGTLTLNLDGSFTYQPEPGFVGHDSFTYRASDGTDTSGEVIVSIQVNAPPQAQDDSYTTPEDTPLVVDINAGVLVNDSDPESDPFRADLVSLPQHGTVAFQADGSFTYTPNPNFHGTDQFTYVAFDDFGQSQVATVTITVTSVNDPPQATSDSYSIVQDGTLVVPPGQGVLANDTDADGDALTASVVSLPQHGALTFQSDGSFTYIPDAGFSGSDTFVYEVSDGTATAQAVVTLTITPSGGEGEAPLSAPAVDDALSTLCDSNTPWEEAVDACMAELGG
jgi:VCBS repeat-containing protein